MSDECTHEVDDSRSESSTDSTDAVCCEKAKITVDGEDGPERVCILCEDIDFETIDEYQ